MPAAPIPSGENPTSLIQDLQRANQQLAAILRGVTDGIMALQPGGRIVYANEAAARFFGYPAAPALSGLQVEPVAKTFHEILDAAYQPVAPDELPGIRALRGETVPETTLHYRLTADAPRRTIIVKAAPVLVESGQVTLAIATFQEITERFRLDRLKNDFLNAVSHELRTPLTSIKGYAEFLEDEVGGPLAAEQHGFVSQLKQGVLQLEALVDDLLDFASMEAGTFSLRIEDVDLTRIIQTVAQSFQPQLDEKHLRLEVEVPEDPIGLKADPRRLMQVLNNLVGNAAKFTPAGGKIRLAVEAKEGEVLIHVQDNGIGIAPADQDRIFSKFFQADGALNRNFKGVGLGLAIVKSLIEAHHGRITLRSQPEHGTCFTVCLPQNR